MDLFHEYDMHMGILLIVVIVHPPDHVVRVETDAFEISGQGFGDDCSIIVDIIHIALEGVLIVLERDDSVPTDIAVFMECLGYLLLESRHLVFRQPAIAGEGTRRIILARIA